MQHPDEGTIHAWLDGALPDAEARALEAHVAGCPACAASVAEARGVLAGASRIVAALDAAPADITPRRGAPSSRSTRGASWWRRPGVGIAAAMAIVAVGSTWAVTRDWARQPVVRQEAASPVELRVADSVAPQAEAAAANASEAAPPPPLVSVPVTTRAEDDAAAPQRGVAGGVTRGASDAAANAAAQRVAEAESIEATASRLVQPRQEAAIADVTQEKAAAADRPPLAVAGITVDSAPSPSAPRPSPGAAGARRRVMQAPPEPAVQTFDASSVGPEGCYALEPERTPDGILPPLGRIVRLGAEVDRSERAQRAVAASGAEARRALPSFVPPAADSGAIGWRQDGDSIRVRFTRGDDGDAVLLVFPAAGDSIRTGVASSTSATGIRAWRVAVTVRRVLCPSR